MVPLSYNVRSLWVRKTTSLFTAGGLGLVSFVLATVMMVNSGIEQAMGRSGSEDVAIVLSKGAESETYSIIDKSKVPIILSALEVARHPTLGPAGSGEVVVVLGMERNDSKQFGQVIVRGVPPLAITFRHGLKVVAGRAANANTNEVMIGKGIRGRYKGSNLGDTIQIGKNRPFKVVGVFEAQGSSAESEVWGDASNIATATGREQLVSSVRVKLTSASRLAAFKASIESNRRLPLQVWREPDYYDKLSLGTRVFILAMGALITIFFSLGAIIGATITMHASVANRRKEIGTLRALGFGKMAILIGFVMESTALSLIGGAVGVALSMLMGLVEFKTTNFSSWSEVVFTLQPTPRVMLTAVGFAGVMGLLGGFFPALRAARMQLLAALKS
jgi:putative ABC transport system permease protein